MKSIFNPLLKLGFQKISDLLNSSNNWLQNQLFAQLAGSGDIIVGADNNGLLKKLNINNFYFDATVGIGGQYATVNLAQAAGKFILKQVNNIIETSSVYLDNRTIIVNQNASYNWTFSGIETFLVVADNNKIIGCNIINNLRTSGGIVGRNEVTGKNSIIVPEFQYCSFVFTGGAALTSTYNIYINFRYCKITLGNAYWAGLAYAGYVAFTNFYNCYITGGGTSCHINSTQGDIIGCVINAVVSAGSSTLSARDILDTQILSTTMSVTATRRIDNVYSNSPLICNSGAGWGSEDAKVSNSSFPNIAGYNVPLFKIIDSLTFTGATTFYSTNSNLNNCQFKSTLSIINKNNNIDAVFSGNVSIAGTANSTKITGKCLGSLTLAPGVANCDINVGIASAANIIDNSGNLTNRISYYLLT